MGTIAQVTKAMQRVLITGADEGSSTSGGASCTRRPASAARLALADWTILVTNAPRPAGPGEGAGAAAGALGIIQRATSVYPRQLDRIALHGARGTILLEDYTIAGWQLDGVAPGAPTAEDLALPGADKGTSVGHFLQIQDMADAVRALHSLAVIRAT